MPKRVTTKQRAIELLQGQTIDPQLRKAISRVEMSVRNTIVDLAVQKRFDSGLLQTAKAAEELTKQRTQHENRAIELQEEIDNPINANLVRELVNPSNWDGNTWRPALATDSDILAFLDKVFPNDQG